MASATLFSTFGINLQSGNTPVTCALHESPVGVKAGDHTAIKVAKAALLAILSMVTLLADIAYVAGRAIRQKIFQVFLHPDKALTEKSPEAPQIKVADANTKTEKAVVSSETTTPSLSVVSEPASPAHSYLKQALKVAAIATAVGVAGYYLLPMLATGAATAANATGEAAGEFAQKVYEGFPEPVQQTVELAGKGVQVVISAGSAAVTIAGQVPGVVNKALDGLANLGSVANDAAAYIMGSEPASPNESFDGTDALTGAAVLAGAVTLGVTGEYLTWPNLGKVVTPPLLLAPLLREAVLSPDLSDKVIAAASLTAGYVAQHYLTAQPKKDSEMVKAAKILASAMGGNRAAPVVVRAAAPVAAWKIKLMATSVAAAGAVALTYLVNRLNPTNR